jgi:large subunit ribosomal protein L6
MEKKKPYQKEIIIPDNINITRETHLLVFKGPLGTTYIDLNKVDPFGLIAIFVDTEKRVVHFRTHSKSLYGLIHSIIESKILGVSRGFLVYLKIVGIGYRANMDKNSLYFKLGYSHDIRYSIPKGVKIFLLDSTTLCVFGVDKNQVTQIAAKVRLLRTPSTYKGKGIRISTEKITIKAGKRK